MKSLFRMRSAALLAATVLGQALAPGALVSAAATAAPSPGSIEVQNRLAGTPDTVTVTGLAAGDTVKVYSDPVSAGDLLGSATVASGMTNAVVTVSQIGEEKGLLYVTVTRPSYSESRRILKTFPAEPESVPPAPASIRMINNPAGTADRIYVSGLTPGIRPRFTRSARAEARRERPWWRPEGIRRRSRYPSSEQAMESRMFRSGRRADGKAAARKKPMPPRR
ncbi:hypothetical protein LJK88_06125 [Paenibacillus sp. P26]|nr:hypothetical protein LJK88_06125 [Paenibacillus sp. P26]